MALYSPGKYDFRGFECKLEEGWKLSIRELVESSLGSDIPDELKIMVGFLPSMRTRDLTVGEIKSEMKEWLETKGRVAIVKSTNAGIEFMGYRNGKMKIKVYTSQGKSYTTYKYESSVFEDFLSGEYVIEDGERDGGGFGQKFNDYVMQRIEAVQFGRMTVAKEIGLL